jgi:HEAT repeat protein
MQDPDTIPDGLPAGPLRRPAEDDPLPPVEPPSAAFLVQLFLVPGIIVAIIVSVWLAFHWLAHLGSDPRALVRTLRRDNEGRWQAALNLANDLRGPGGAALKADATLAEELGRILDDEVKSGRTGEQSQTLRGYLCRALGEFSTQAAAPALLRRASDPSDPATARAAVEAIAVLAANLSAESGSVERSVERSVEKGFGDEGARDVRRAVLLASRSDDSGVRSAAAFALGVLGGKEAEERLVELARSGDADPRAADVRFNAATGLARLGRSEAYEPLVEMLSQPDEPPAEGQGADESTELAQSKRYKRAMVVVNALRAVAMLVDGSGEAPPGRIVELVTSLEKDPVPDVRAAAVALSVKLRRKAG